jgi:hypothetical protein
MSDDIKKMMAQLTENLNLIKSCVQKSDEEMDDQMKSPEAPPMEAPAPEAPPMDAPPAEAPPMEAPAPAPEAPEEPEGQGDLAGLQGIIDSIPKEMLPQVLEMIQAKMNEPDLGEMQKSMKALLNKVNSLESQLRKNSNTVQTPSKITVEPSTTVNNMDINKSTQVETGYKAYKKDELQRELRKSRKIVEVPNSVLQMLDGIKGTDSEMQALYEFARQNRCDLPEKK